MAPEVLLLIAALALISDDLPDGAAGLWAATELRKGMVPLCHENF